MTDPATGSVARPLAHATSVDAYLAVEASSATAERFADLETAAAAVLTCAFAGHVPIRAPAKGDLAYASAVPTSGVDVLDTAFDAAGQQARGAWWLPDRVSVRFGLVNLAAYYRGHPTWAMTLSADDHGRFPLASPAAFACWSLLAPLASDLLEPLQLRGPDNGSLKPDAAAVRWSAIAHRYAELSVGTESVLSALDEMRPGHGWSRLDPAGQVSVKQQLVAALAEAFGPDTVRRWRTFPLRELAARYLAKSIHGPAESRAVLVRAVQSTVAAWFGGNWLECLDYFGEQAAGGEAIQATLPAPRLYVEGSAKVQQVARERNLPTADVSAMLASYLGSDAAQSPVQRRVEVIHAWWSALDTAQTNQQPGMPMLDALLDSQAPSPGEPEDEDPFAAPAWVSCLPAPTRDDISELWGRMMFPTKAGRIVSSLSPVETMRQALGPGLQFWYEVGQLCWHICERTYSRTDLPGMRGYYARHIAAMADAGTPVDSSLFDELEAAEARLGPPEPLMDPGEPIEASFGIDMTFSVGRPSTRRRGFEILRDIVTAHRRAWAAAHLETAIRTGWEQPLRKFADTINQAIAARGKLPTSRQLAIAAEQLTNAWFGADLSATLAAVGEKPVNQQIDARLLPADRSAYCRRVWRGLGGEPVSDRQDSRYWTADTLLWLAAKAPRLVQREELLGRPPTAKEAGYDTYKNWPAGVDFDRYLQAATDARSGTIASASGGGTIAAETVATQEAAADHASVTSSKQEPAAPALTAAWPPDPHQPGPLRRWDGATWTPITASGPTAAPAGFTHPKSTRLLRRFGYNKHAPAAPSAPASRNDGSAGGAPPWEVAGLPCGLTAEDFAAARLVAATLTDTVASDVHVLGPARGPWARYFNAAGSHYPHNQARLNTLTARPPLARTDEGWSVYPAVLIPDPSPADYGTIPVGACSEVGYVGSAWCSLATTWAQRVAELLAARRYVVTRLAVAKDGSELMAKIWLPTLDLPPQQS